MYDMTYQYDSVAMIPGTDLDPDRNLINIMPLPSDEEPDYFLAIVALETETRCYDSEIGTRTTLHS